MIENSPVYATLTDVFRECFEDDELVLSEEMTAEDVAEWTSLSHIRLVLMIEERFAARFAAAEVAELENVGDLIRLIESKTQS